MLGSGAGRSVAVFGLLASVGTAAATLRAPTDARLVFERIAAEPEIVTPTGLAVNGRGRVLVIESHTHFPPKDYSGPRADRIRVFEDRDGDGRPECVGSFFEGTRWTMNLAIAQRRLGLRRDPVGPLSPGGPRRRRPGRWDRRAAKSPRRSSGSTRRATTPITACRASRSMPWDRVYFGLGENLGADYRLIGCDGDHAHGRRRRGQHYRCRPDGTKLERVATGFWNPFHMTFDRSAGSSPWTMTPTRGRPCRLLHIVEGGDYGYRFRNGRKGLHPFTAWNGELPGTLGMVAGTGEAPSGIVAYESGNLPARLPRDAAGHLVGRSSHRAIRPPAARGLLPRAMKPVVVGGDDFRPVGIAVAPDGSLYISDWVDKSYTLHGKGRIWRLRRNPGCSGSRPQRRHAVCPPVRSNGSPPCRRDSPARFGSPRRACHAPGRSGAARDLLLEGLDSDDPFIQQAARQGLKHSLGSEE